MKAVATLTPSLRPSARGALAALVVLLLALAALLFLRPLSGSHRASSGSLEAGTPLLLAPVGEAPSPSLAVQHTGLVLLDARTGSVRNRFTFSEPNEVIRGYLLPGGVQALLYRAPLETNATTYPSLELWRVSDWTVERSVPITPDIAPVRILAAQYPSTAGQTPTVLDLASDPAGHWVAVAFWSMATPYSDGTRSQLVWVTSLDLQTGQWAPWVYPLPSSQTVSLLALSDRILVLAHSLRTTTRHTVANLVSLDPRNGTVLAELPLESWSVQGKPLDEDPSSPHNTFSTALPPQLWNNRILVVTDDLELFLIDPRSLRLVEHRPPLADRLVVGGRPYLIGDLLVLVGQSLWVLDVSNGRVITTFPLPTIPEGNWLLAGVDTAQRTAFLLNTKEGCLRNLDLSSGTLSEPLHCNLALDYPAPLFGWPAFATGAP